MKLRIYKMRRTSTTQFDMMVTYMEQYGDLNKPSATSRGRAQTYQRWSDLSTFLNSDATGGEKSEEQWKKVWRDLKSNTKKKSARIHRAACGTGGGPPLNSKLSNLEQRVMQIIGPEAASGLNEVTEAGFSQELVAHLSTSPIPTSSQMDSIVVEYCPPIEEINITAEQDPLFEIVERNGPGPSTIRLPVSPCPSRPASVGQTTPQRRRVAPGRIRRSPRRRLRPRTAVEMAHQAFQQSDEDWRQFLSEKHRQEQENERERLQLRAIELQVQEQWQEIAKRALDIFEKK